LASLIKRRTSQHKITEDKVWNVDRGGHKASYDFNLSFSLKKINAAVACTVQ